MVTLWLCLAVGTLTVTIVAGCAFLGFRLGVWIGGALYGERESIPVPFGGRPILWPERCRPFLSVRRTLGVRARMHGVGWVEAMEP